ncbi:MAG: N-formylglutamate amidohydrolase, partial [Fibrobacterota bacterium]
MDCFVVTCEHGGNQIPADYESFFVDHAALLETHRGYDPGALLFAQELSTALHSPLVASTTSRLLVDLNRSIGNRHLFFEATASINPDVRTEIVAKYYQPYRTEVDNLVAKAVADGQRVIHVSSHSFTPVLDGEIRNADVGLLYDPARHPE